MRNMLTFGAVLASLITTSTNVMAQRQGNPAQDRESVANGWVFDYSAAQEQSRRTGKPMMVVLRCVP